MKSFYDANLQLTRRGAPFNFYDPNRPIFTRPRFLPASRFNGCDIRASLAAEGCFFDQCHVNESIVGLRTRVDRGARISRSVLLGADFYESEEEAPARRTGQPALGIGREAVLDRVIVDKNARIGEGARLVNEAGLDHADGPGYHIRNGIIIVPKGGVVPPGTVV
jgi:glucose-1-phosphate adenylyltransferase